MGWGARASTSLVIRWGTRAWGFVSAVSEGPALLGGTWSLQCPGRRAVILSITPHASSSALHPPAIHDNLRRHMAMPLSLFCSFMFIFTWSAELPRCSFFTLLERYLPPHCVLIIRPSAIYFAAECPMLFVPFAFASCAKPPIRLSMRHDYIADVIEPFIIL